MSRIDYSVDVRTLERRLDLLEGRLTGVINRLPGPQPLLGLYSDYLLSGVPLTQSAANHLSAVVLLLTPRVLLDLCRMTHDMFAWRPFLAALDHLDAAGFDVRGPIAWLEGCIEDLLAAQGLGALQICDVVRAPHHGTEKLRQMCLSTP